MKAGLVTLLWAILSSISWGTADFFAKLSADRLGALWTLFWAQALGALILGGFMLGGGLPATDPGAWGLAMVLGVTNTVAIGLLYRSFEIGTLSLVSPLASSYPVFSLFLAFLLLHEAWTPAKAGGIAAVLGGSLIASWVAPSESDSGPGTLARGVPEALGANLGMGVTMFGLAYVAAPLGALAATWVLRATATVTLLVWAIARRLPVPLPPRPLWPVILGMALTDTFAFYAYNQAVQEQAVGLAAPIAGTFAVPTLILARLVLKERLRPHQWLGIGGVLAGIVLVSWPGG